MDCMEGKVLLTDSIVVIRIWSTGVKGIDSTAV